MMMKTLLLIIGSSICALSLQQAEGLKLIGAGLGRTGTSSTYVALNKLGYTTFHMQEVLFGKYGHNYTLVEKFTGFRERSQAWIDISNAKKAGNKPLLMKLLKTWFDTYNATVDNPGCIYFEELMELYPDAKVLLTIRENGEEWYESLIHSVFSIQIDPIFSKIVLLTPLGYPESRVKQFGGIPFKELATKTAGAKFYEKWIEHVKKTVPKEKLLVMKVGPESYPILCNFLGENQPICKETFPRTNDRAEWEVILRRQKTAGYVFFGIEVILLVSVLRFLMGRVSPGKTSKVSGRGGQGDNKKHD